MKNRIIEICELGQPQSIIHRENQPISELIKTDSLIEELNQQLILHNVVGQSEQLHKMLQYLGDEDELVGGRTHQDIIDSFNKLV